MPIGVVCICCEAR